MWVVAVTMLFASRVQVWGCSWLLDHAATKECRRVQRPPQPQRWNFPCFRGVHPHQPSSRVRQRAVPAALFLRSIPGRVPEVKVQNQPARVDDQRQLVQGTLRAHISCCMCVRLRHFSSLLDCSCVCGASAAPFSSLPPRRARPRRTRCGCWRPTSLPRSALGS